MWITEYRQRYGLTLEQLAGMIRRAGARKDPELWISDQLLYMLETREGFKTVPKLADLIAEACGATAKQRDELVLEQYRGKWKPTRVKPEIQRRAAIQKPLNPPMPQKEAQPRPAFKARKVVKVNRYGIELERYRSCDMAGAMCGVSAKYVNQRCHHRLKYDEFNMINGRTYTFRFADEWDVMSEDERLKDLTRYEGVKGPRGGTHGSQMITVITRHGQVREFDSIKEAAKGTGVGYGILTARLYNACKRSIPALELDGVRFMLTETWDSMDPIEQARLAGHIK